MITRRTALVSGAAALAVAGCGGRRARMLAGDPRDVRILAAALESERAQIAVYEIGVTLMSDSLVRTILAQERAHAAAVAELIRELGATPAAAHPAASYRRGVPTSAAAWRRYAIAAEQQWSAGYEAVVPKLVTPRLRSTLASLMTTEAEHAVALGLR